MDLYALKLRNFKKSTINYENLIQKRYNLHLKVDFRYKRLKASYKEVLQMCGGNHDHHHPQVIKIIPKKTNGDKTELKKEEIEVNSSCGCTCNCGKN